MIFLQHLLPLPVADTNLIMPKGARQMLRLVEDHGLWPNDAIMCKQLIPSLGVTKKFYTEVQGTPSTTSR